MTTRITVLVWTAAATMSWAQITQPAGGAQPAPPDPLGRDTPRGTMLGFVRAAQAGRYQTAAEYLQVPASQRGSQGVRLANQLQALMDHGYFGNLDLISDSRDGSVDDGLPANRELVGDIRVEGQRLMLTLTRVASDEGPRVWVVSQETLRQISTMYSRVGFPDLEARLPASLIERHLLRMPLWQWLAVILFLPLAMLSGWAIVGLALLVSRLVRGVKIESGSWYTARGPAIALAGLLVHWIWIYVIRAPLLYRQYYNRVIVVAMLAVLAWLVWRVTNMAIAAARTRAMATGQLATGTLLLLGRRIFKVCLLLALLLAVLSSLGFRITPVLTGLGIGGIALALAAQKTLENFIGGLSVLSDRVIRVGDVCRFGESLGVIEDIGLRSTRVRTLERTELAIPNGAVATMNVENLSMRDKILLKTTIGLRYETTADQLRCVLAEVRRILYSHPMVEAESARIRFTGFGASQLDCEIFCYITTSQFPVFAAAREDVLLRVMDAVYESGTSFAFPSQTIYMGRDRAPDPARAEEASQKVAAWREGRQLPFPDFDAESVAAMRETLPWPPPGSAMASPSADGQQALPLP